MGFLDGLEFKLMGKVTGKVQAAGKKQLLKQFEKSIPKGLRSGNIKWNDNFDKMAGDILDLTGKRETFESYGLVTVDDIKEVLEKHKDEWKGLGVN